MPSSLYLIIIINTCMKLLPLLIFKTKKTIISKLYYAVQFLLQALNRTTKMKSKEIIKVQHYTENSLYSKSVEYKESIM